MGNCSQCVGRDCGFKYQKYEFLREVTIDSFFSLKMYQKSLFFQKIKEKYEMRYFNKGCFIGGISEKSPEYEQDSFQFDEKTTQNIGFQPNIIMSEPKNEKNFENIGERCGSPLKILIFIHNIP